MNDNVFKILGIQSREDSVSNAIAYAFNQSTEFRRGFLNYICNKDSESFNKCTAYTRVSAGESGIPDLVIVCESVDNAELIVIENKLKADEGVDQTQRYGSAECINALHRRLCPDFKRERVKASFYFLTLFPDQEPSSKKFFVKKHFHLFNIFPGRIDIRNLADRLISDWIDLIEAFYSRSIVDLDDKICQKLQDNDGLDGGYLYFRTFFDQVILPGGLEREWFFRDSRQGRRYYGALFSKESWHPAEMIESGGSWVLDSENVFNIHFEPQFNVLNGIFSIFLHYEVNPYKTATWVENNIPKGQYDAYLSRRNKFIELLAQTGIKKWGFGGGSNQIAKVRLNFQKYSTRDAKSAIEQIFHETSEAIDDVLSKLRTLENQPLLFGKG